MLEYFEQTENDIMDEIDGARHYAKTYKGMGDPSNRIAKMYKSMAEQELEHAEMICKALEEQELTEGEAMAHRLLKNRNAKDIMSIREMLEV